MSGDWIKMRTSLLTNPKVNGIARALECSEKVSAALTTGFHGSMRDIVTRNVMRHVTVSALLVIWGAANEHTKDGVFRGADLADIDDMVGIPGFGEAMESVGWAYFDDQEFTVALPNFEEYNTSGELRSAGAKSAAQRQKEYRERKKSDLSESSAKRYVTSDVTNYVTGDVTSNRREEKRREEIKPPTPKGEPDGFSEFWEIWPATTRKQSKGKCLEVWKKQKVESVAADVIRHVNSLKTSQAWTKNGGEFIPAPLVYLNQRRWEGAGVSEPASTLNLIGAI